MTDAGQLVHLLRNVPVKKLIHALERDGFDRARSTAAGSLVYRHPGGRMTVVHYHRASDTLTQKTLTSFMQGTNWDEEQVKKLGLLS